jgi:hypothetical protein
MTAWSRISLFCYQIVILCPDENYLNYVGFDSYPSPLLYKHILLSRHSSRKNDENYQKAQAAWSVARPKFKLDISPIQVYSATASLQISEARTSEEGVCARVCVCVCVCVCEGLLPHKNILRE